MILCPKCKSKIEDDSWYCDQCGFELRFCTQCGKPGKGNRCTFCGGVMYSPAEKVQQYTAPSARMNTTQARTNVPMMGSQPRLYLTNAAMNIRIEGSDGAVLGRRNGPYQSMLQSCSYVSGTHAQLKYDAQKGWSVVDMNSTNGTLLNRSKLTPGVSYALQNGGSLQLANVELKIEIR